jgi:hypothetical protein
LTTLWCELLLKNSTSSPLFSVDKSNIRLGGSTDVKLTDGIKCPDFSLYEDHPAKEALTKAYPTVVWEVAYSEDEKKLAHDLGRLLVCSHSRVRLAIGIKITRNPPGQNP